MLAFGELFEVGAIQSELRGHESPVVAQELFDAAAHGFMPHSDSKTCTPKRAWASVHIWRWVQPALLAID